MPPRRNGFAPNWEPYRADFHAETEFEERDRLEQEAKENPEQDSPPRKRRKTAHYATRTDAQEEHAPAMNEPTFTEPTYLTPRPRNAYSIANWQDTTTSLKHRNTPLGFEYLVTYEKWPELKEWLGVYFVGDEQIEEYWRPLETSLRGKGVEKPSKANPFDGKPVSTINSIKMMHKLNMRIENRQEKVAIAAMSGEEIGKEGEIDGD